MGWLPVISSTKNSASMRLPMRRPCMSVKATMTVSIAPFSTSSDSSSNVSNSAARSPGRRGHLTTLEAGLDDGQLGVVALPPGTLEPVPGREQPPRSGAGEHDGHGDDRVVERLERDRSGLGQHEEDRDERDPDHRHGPDRTA